ENGIVNVGTGQVTNFNRIIEILNEILGTDFKPEYFDNPYDFYQNQTQADTALAANLLGFKAKFSIEEGIKDYFSFQG
ncbi:ADP-glyceromanno-heptose 6-epimerase, partial [bacterium]|nr:ADP-glyceromanno-heptose 6-epimerase [bacterium]